MKKFLPAALILAFILAGTTLFAQTAPTGLWQNIDDVTGKPKAHIEIYEQGGVLYGKIVKLLLKPQDTLCDKCKGALYNKPVVGMVFLKDMKYDAGKKEYSGGQILDPDKGTWYKCTIKVESSDKLTVRGFIGFSLIGRNQTWVRVK